MREEKPKIFCYWQSANVYDEGRKTKITACTAHLAEARVLECHCKVDEVVYNPKSSYQHGLTLPNDSDFKPLEGRIRQIRKFAIRKLDNI